MNRVRSWLPVATLVALGLAVAAGAAGVRTNRDNEPAPLPSVAPEFEVTVVARVQGARELAVAPTGDLFVGTGGRIVGIVPDATGSPGPPAVFARIDDDDSAGVALGDGALFVGSNHAVWRIAYRAGDRSAASAPERIASVRPGGSAGHATTSVAVAGDRLFVSVGSSCNACVETDVTRAKIFEMPAGGGTLAPKAVDVRNAIALAVDPASGDLWAGVAGQDELEHGHPYEIFDDVSAHAGTVDYGWPFCYENRRAIDGHDCAHVALPRVVFPAYETPIGAAFYPLDEHGAHAFPASYRGGAFVALHGSWHQPPVPPRVVFVPRNGNEPLKPVDWNDPSAQWHEFVGGFQGADGSRSGRPTGVAVGPDGSLFVADDTADAIYRIRPKR